MANDLVTPAELADFPGAPFTDAAVDAAVGRVRDLAGWHIAPLVTEMLTVDGSSTKQLVLPSLRVTDITEVRDVTDSGNPVVLTGWRKSSAGIVSRDYGWPRGDDSIEVDLTHGYDETPPSLLPLVAALANMSSTDATVTEENAGPFGVKRTDLAALDEHTETQMSVLDLYTVRAGF